MGKTKIKTLVPRNEFRFRFLLEYFIIPFISLWNFNWRKGVSGSNGIHRYVDLLNFVGTLSQCNITFLAAESQNKASVIICQLNVIR